MLIFCFTFNTYRFPKNKDIKDKWMAAIGVSSYVIVARDVICSEHFNKEDYEKKSPNSRRKLLKKNAVPSLNIVRQLNN